MGTVRSCATLTASLLALTAGAAAAAGPGDVLLVSGPAGLGPVPADAWAWNASGYADGQGRPVSLSSAAGRVAFITSADGLALGADPKYQHVAVKDRGTGAITVVAPQANGSASEPSISDDGTKVAFLSAASNLSPADTDRTTDVYVADLVAGTVTLASPGVSSAVREPVMSGNGLAVAFTTQQSLVGADTNGTTSDVYRADADGTDITLVSRAPGVGGAVGNGESQSPSISDNGALVAFSSAATNFTGADADSSRDVYVRNVAVGTTTLVSRNSGGVNTANGSAVSPQISGNGIHVAFESSATDAIAADTNSADSIYRAAASGGTSTLVSQTTGGTNADAGTGIGQISDNGDVVSFATGAPSFGVAPGAYRTFVRRIGAGQTTSPLGTSTAYEAAVSGDGSFVAAYRVDDPTGSGSVSNVSGAPVLGGTIELLSRPATGPPLTPQFTGVSSLFYYEGLGRALSADGRYAVYASSSPALAPDDPAERVRCFLRDLRTGTVQRLSAGPSPGFTYCERPSVSADGSRVAFNATSGLEGGAVDPAVSRAYVRDVSTGGLTVASVMPDGSPNTNTVRDLQLSGDGRRVAFLLSEPGPDHLYVRDLVAGTTVIADRATGAAGALANDTVENFELDADGSRVVFSTEATNLGDGDADATQDIFVRDVDAQTTQLVSRRSDVDGGAKSSSLSTTPWISGDGNTVVFRSYGQNLDTSAGAWPTTPQLVARDLTTRTTRVVSREGLTGPLAQAGVGIASLSDDGRSMAYEADADGTAGAFGLPVPASGTGVILRDLTTGAQSLVSASVVEPGSPEASGARTPVLSPDGSCVMFVDRTGDLVPGVSPDYDELYAKVLSGSCGTVAPASPTPISTPAPKPGATPVPGGSSPAVAPKLSKVSLLRSRFRVSGKATAKTSATNRKRTPAGTAFRFTLDRPSTLRFVIERRTTGRRVGKTCRKATRSLRKRKPCVRYVKVGTLTRRNLKAGRRSVAFSGRIGKKKLAVGRYRVAIQATATTGGKRSTTSRRTFTVVSR